MQLILGIILVLLPLSSPWACTVTWMNQDVDIHNPAQKAVILFDEGREDLIIQLSFEGTPREFSWVLPLPNIPTVEKGPPKLFEELSRRTQRPWRLLSRPGWRRYACAGSGVQIKKEMTVGVFDVQILTAADGSSLFTWFEEEGYDICDSAVDTLQDYIDKNWCFITLKIHDAVPDSVAAVKLMAGTIQALKFSFETPRPVYPLALSTHLSNWNEILVYTIGRQSLVPADRLDTHWRCQFFGPLKVDYRFPATLLVDFPEFDAGHGHLTKCRAVFADQEMEDVYFRPYDAVASLTSDSLRTRCEGVSLLAYDKSDRAKQALLDFVAQATDCGKDMESAICALGHRGGSDVLASLLAIAKSGDYGCRLEAIEALGSLEDPRALPAFIEGVLDTIPYQEDPAYACRAYREACCKWLVQQGDSTCIAPLRIRFDVAYGIDIWMLDPNELRRGRHGRKANFSGWRESIEDVRRTLIALVACGDEELKTDLIDKIVKQGIHYTSQQRRQSRIMRGSMNGIPNAHITGVSIAHPKMMRDWYTLVLPLEELETRPDLQDEIFRSAADHPDTPDMNRTILLALLNDHRDRDVVMLKELFHGAMKNPELSSVNACLRTLTLAPEPVEVDLSAAGVAYALAHLGEVEALRELHSLVPMENLTLRGEFAAAMCRFCRSDDPRSQDAEFDILLPYLFDVWNARAATPEFDDLVEALSKGIVNWSGRPVFDPLYLNKPMVQRWRQIALRPEVLHDILLDSNWHPNLRLYLISQTYRLKAPTKLRELVVTELTAQLGQTDEKWKKSLIQELLDRWKSPVSIPPVVSSDNLVY